MQTLLFNHDFVTTVTGYACIAGAICAIIGAYRKKQTLSNIGTALFLFSIIYIMVFVVVNIITNPL